MKKFSRLFLVAFGGAAMLGALPASAITLVSTSYLGDSDCSGVFGRPFNSCVIPGDGSKIVAKFDATAAPQFATAYPTINGSEFAFTGLNGGGVNGTFTYTQGAGDPNLRFWVVKAGNGFVLYYYVPNAGDPITAALALVSGQSYNWTTGVQQGVSHISFYNQAGGGFPVPEPGTLALVGLGLMGLGFARRKA